MPDSAIRYVLVYGDGKTDIGSTWGKPVDPREGVVPILLHRACGSPAHLKVNSRAHPHLHGRGGLPGKLRFVQRQAQYDAKASAIVFVVDTEGDLTVAARLRSVRDAGPAKVPCVVGVAHPCIEAWLLADPAAVGRVAEFSVPLPPAPEDMPAPCRSTRERLDPKAHLAVHCRVDSAQAKWKIAAEIRNLDLLAEKCPLGFAPFRAEVLERIAPLHQGATESPRRT